MTTQKSKFTDAYKDTRWQKKRMAILERDEYKCRWCFAEGDGVTLEIHHAYYTPNAKPWEYPDEHLISLCSDCHKEMRETQRKLSIALLQYDINTKNLLLYLSGLDQIYLTSLAEIDVNLVDNIIRYVHAQRLEAYRIGLNNGASK